MGLLVSRARNHFWILSRIGCVSHVLTRVHVCNAVAVHVMGNSTLVVLVLAIIMVNRERYLSIKKQVR